jgi:hypothetical protein
MQIHMKAVNEGLGSEYGNFVHIFMINIYGHTLLHQVQFFRSNNFLI